MTLPFQANFNYVQVHIGKTKYPWLGKSNYTILLHNNYFTQQGFETLYHWNPPIKPDAKMEGFLNPLVSTSTNSCPLMAVERNLHSTTSLESLEDMSLFFCSPEGLKILQIQHQASNKWRGFLIREIMGGCIICPIVVTSQHVAI